MRTRRYVILAAAVLLGPPPLYPQPTQQSVEAQLDSAARIVHSLRDTLAARLKGYRRIAPPSLTDLNPMAGEHWINPRFNRTRALDLARPAYLMYYPFIGDDSLTLVGVGYTVAQPADSDPPIAFAGAGHRWHVHLPCGGVPGLGTILAESSTACDEFGGRPGQWQIAMVHVWADTVPSPDGPFAQFNPALPYLVVSIDPPSVEEFSDHDTSRLLRELALALGETFGAVPRMGARIAQNPDSVFADHVRPYRDRIRALLPALREAQVHDDATRFYALANEAIAAWQPIRAAYLDAAFSPQHQLILSRWFEAAITGYHRTQLPH